jgi:hypothetical protein
MTTRVSIQTVIRSHHETWGAGDWFAPNAMRFFGTTLPRHAWRTNDAYLFVTGERRPNSNDPRMFSIRTMDARTGEITTVGEFGEYATRSAANRVAAAFAAV